MSLDRVIKRFLTVFFSIYFFSRTGCRMNATRRNVFQKFIYYPRQVGELHGTSSAGHRNRVTMARTLLAFLSVLGVLSMSVNGSHQLDKVFRGIIGNSVSE